MNFSTPLWITNCKNYEQAVGGNAVELAMIHDEVAKETGLQAVVAVNAIDLATTVQAVNIPVLAQHVDGIDYGSKTGHIHPEVVKNVGAAATLLNHSEHRLSEEALKSAIQKCKEVGLQTIVCAESPEEVKKFADFLPDVLAYEPPELIGSSDVSVASKPEAIKAALEYSGDIPLLVGAGIARPEDVRISLELGAKGFLVASAIVKAADPAAKLREFLAEF